MAYYTALIAKWGTAPAGTTQQKLDWVNAQTVVGAAVPMIVPYREIYNRMDRTQFNALTAANQAIVQRMMSQETLDFGPASEARRQMYAMFPSGTSRTNLANYAATFDTPLIPWPLGTIAQGGGGLNGMVSMNDLTAAGII
jgi:hypothetical protein